MTKDRKIANVHVDQSGNYYVAIQWSTYSAERVNFTTQATAKNDAEHYANALNSARKHGWDSAMTAVRELIGIKEEE